MEKLAVFQNTQIQMIVEKGEPLFELYSTGMALGYAKSNGKNKGVQSVHPNAKTTFPFKSRIDIVVENADIKPCVRNAHKYINESQLYDFMLEARTDKCREFRKWVTNEVLPSIRKTGKYEQMSFQPAPPKRLPKKTEYVYFDKTFDGVPVLTTEDVEHLTGVKPSTTGWYIRKYMQKSADFYLLEKGDLMRYKQQNPRANKGSSVLLLVTRSGFVKLCQTYGVQIEQPKCFEQKQDKKLLPLPTTGDCIATLNVLNFLKETANERVNDPKNTDTMKECEKATAKQMSDCITRVSLFLAAL